MNTICISGRITHDLELRTTPTNVSVCTFNVAVDRPGVKDKTDFIDCVAWRNSAEFVTKYFHKGDPIEVCGCLTTRNYEDKSGNKRKAVEVVCDRVSFVKQSRRNENEGHTENKPAASADEFYQVSDDDDSLPWN